VLGILAKVIRVASIVICLIVLVSFAVFAINQTKSASGHQREVLGESAASVNEGSSAKHKESSAHKTLDEVASKLTSPFSGIVTSSSEWAKETFNLVMALLIYGFGLSYIARVLRVRS
jgi:predicted PurR-regulated permease PerM